MFIASAGTPMPAMDTRATMDAISLQAGLRVDLSQSAFRRYCRSSIRGPGGAASTAAAGRRARTRRQSKSGCPSFAVLRQLPCHGQTDFLSRLIWLFVLPFLTCCPPYYDVLSSFVIKMGAINIVHTFILWTSRSGARHVKIIPRRAVRS